jgi:hypothetical protein
MKRSRITLISLLAGAAALFIAVAVALPDERPSPVEEGEYIGAKKCKMCHIKLFKSWEETPHAKAAEVLPDDKSGDAACLKCHGTGAGQPGGVTENAEDLAGVQCEMCHGPGKAHYDFMKENRKAVKEDAELKAKGIAMLKDSTSTCWRCHLAMTHGEHPPRD